jgi:hypothetical protein
MPTEQSGQPGVYRHLGRTMRVRLASPDPTAGVDGELISELEDAAARFGKSSVRAAATFGVFEAQYYMERRQLAGLPIGDVIYYGVVNGQGFLVEEGELVEPE